MKDKFSKFINLQGKYLTSLLILLAMSIGYAWGADIFSWTVSSAIAKNASEDATGGTVSCTGSGMGSETPSSGAGFYKFNSSTQLTFTLSSGTYAAGDVITFTFTSGGNNKTVGVEIQETSPATQLTETVATKGTSVTKTYTVAASDGIQGQNSFSIKRVDSNFGIKSVVVSRSGGDTPVCPSGLTISSKNDQVAFTEGEKVELTAALSAGNGTITYQWYKGSVASGNEISGATTNKLTINTCAVADAGDYFCVASKESCSDAVNASAFAIAVAADTKCFNMPAITSKPSDLASVTVSGGTLSDVSTAKSVAMNANGLKLDGNNVYLKVSLAGASIVEGTKITVAWKGAGSGAGIAVVNENLAEKVIDETDVAAAGSASHTFTAAEAANYADEFIIHRNASGTGIYVNAITVEDCGPAIVKHTITLDYNDGETANGSITVVDGNAAVQPADPTRGKYTFLGWNNGASAYDWTAAVTGDLTLTAQWQDPWTITFSDGEAAGASSLDVTSITVKHNTSANAEKPADPTWTGHDFNGWKEGGVAFDWTAAVTANHTLVADWITPVAKYDVEYYDGETLLGTEEQVRADQHPTAAGITTERPLYTFDGWFTTSALSGDPVDLNTVTPVEGLKFYGKWTKVYATSYDMEAYAVSDGATLGTLLSNLDAAGYAYSNVNGIDYGHTHNYIYDGMKWKTNDGNISFNVVSGKLVIVKTGNLPTGGAVMNINGVADPTVFASANEAVETHKNNYFYSGASDALFRLDMNGSKGTCVLKAITIQDPFTVTFEAHGDADPSALPGQPSVTLPAATNGTASLLGWFDAETGGNKIGDAGDSYTPTANITLHAQWEAVSTDARLASITLDPSTGVWEPAFDPEVVNYTYTMPYGTVAVPQITGATAVNAGGSYSIVSQASAWDETAVIRGVAASSDTKAYNITMKIAPKDGVSIITATLSGESGKAATCTVTGLIGGTAAVNLSNMKSDGGAKLDNGKSFGITLAEGTFQAGDVVNVNITTAAGQGTFAVWADNACSELIVDAGVVGVAGSNKVVLPAAVAGKSTIYLARTDAVNNWNPQLNVFEVLRPMNPMLTAMTIDGRTVTINEAAKTATCTIPYEADLAALTVVPTIVRNAPHATTPEAVISNAGAWIEGDNTYRVMDKDGDYTDYTITLTRDVQKHTVSFNTHGGSAVASEEVEHNAYLAAAPADPTKEDYIFQYWSLSDGGAEVDVTTVQINEDKEFHAVWVADGAIKLLDGSTVNHTNFITAVTADETVEFQGNTVNYAKFSGTCSGVNSVKDLTRVIAYNATTNKTKIRISAHNNSSSARNILVKGLVEGASAAVDLATIALGNKEDKISDWIEFDNAANRTIYIMVSSSAGDVYFTQVKVIESGETPMKQAGEAGYSLNLNKGRFFGTASTDLAFEGLNARLSGDYTALNSGYAKLNATSMSFTVASDMLLTVTANNNKTYYVTKDAAGTDNETAKTGASEFNLTAGTWFITAGSSEVQITNIAFSAPKCAEPAFNALANSDICEGDPYVALNGTATVADAGVPTYQWYKEDNTPIDGATSAEYTPTEDGKYYVIAINHLAGFTDNEKKSDLVTVATVASTVINEAPKNVRKDAGEAATLTIDASGKNLHYAWKESDAIDGIYTDVAGAADAPSLDVTVPTGVKYYKVVVSSDCGDPVEAIAKVEEWVELSQVDVTATTEWDWANAGGVQIAPEKNVEILMANIKDGDNVMPNDASFNSQALLFSGQESCVKDGGRWFAKGSYIKFNAAVPGAVFVEFSDNGTNNRRLSINGKLSEPSASKTDIKTFMVNVPVGEVTLMGTNEDGTSGYIRFHKITFVKMDYTREVNSGRYGTICLPNGGKMYGAALYEVAYLDEAAKKIYFDEVLNGEMVAGVPYIFLPNKGIDLLAVAYTDEADAPAGNMNGLYGSYSQQLLAQDGNNYILLNNQYLEVNSDEVYVGANRAYIKKAELPTHGSAPAPGRHRVAMGIGGHNTPTGINQITNDQLPMTNKVIINGQLFILRGEKMYDATGRLVK